MSYKKHVILKTDEILKMVIYKNMWFIKMGFRAVVNLLKGDLQGVLNS